MLLRHLTYDTSYTDYHSLHIIGAEPFEEGGSEVSEALGLVNRRLMYTLLLTSRLPEIHLLSIEIFIIGFYYSDSE